MERPSVRSEIQGAVTTIILDRPDRRNAIDRPTGKALAEAFRAFERDKTARVAVLWGDNGTFCAGADLKAVAAGPKKRKIAYGNGPMGPTRMLLQKPVLAAVSGYASIAWLIRFLRVRSTMPFVVYRIALGVVLLALLATGHLH